MAPAELATRFAGSSDLFQSNGRKPWHSESRDNFNAPGQEELLSSNNYALAGRSVLLLIEK
jgi:hypothetical protein